MIFTEARFFAFFALVFCIYWSLTSNTARKIWLLGCSIAFYAAWDWRFLGLVLLTITQTYAATLLLARSDHAATRRLILVLSTGLALLVLSYFKYYNFFIDSISSILTIDLPTRTIILPVGISFYTFHALSYLIDTYRRKIVPSRNIVDVSLYVLFFPQLVAGPIVRATDLLPQMQEARRFETVGAKYFLSVFLIGYFKKAVISDGLAPSVDAFFANPAAFGRDDAVMASFFYSVQIYCDFSGYTDMAIAVAGLLGYRLKPNFAHPYLASNLIEFWRRWHISLSSWLRDYLYFSLGGNRDRIFMQVRNVFITMLLGGLWHGASWTFVVWGAVHGAGLALCHAIHYFVGGTSRRDGRYFLSGNILTFVYVSAAWTLFRSPDGATAIVVFGRFAVSAEPRLMTWGVFLLLAAALGLAHALTYNVNVPQVMARLNNNVFAGLYGAAIAVILPLISLEVVPFIYFQF